jgi:transposase
MIEALIHVIKLRQAEIGMSLAQGNAVTWEAYQRMVGEAQGIQYALDAVDRLLEQEEGKD